ncbi:MAG: hypothetical protein OYG31_02715 [Candidatus Kaiserbacteria bacterium]|nr:hypothetical protein [Candidatus Kaiserbacteria bacterium]
MKAGEISPRYDRTVVILDGDDEGIGEARKEAAERNLVLIENNPCMEGLFLTLLGVNISGRKSGYCKDKFESRYMAKREKRDLNKYKEVFPKNLLDHKRKELEKLNEMISYVEGEDSPSICEGA